MPLAQNALTDVATIEAEIGTLADVRLTAATVERMINVASEAIENFCGRRFGRADVTETLAPVDAFRLIVTRTPIVALVGVTLDGDPVLDVGIENAESGILLRRYGLGPIDYLSAGVSQSAVPGAHPVRFVASYSGGYVLPAQETAERARTLPYDLEEAAIATVVSLIQNRGKDRTVASVSLGDASVAYGGTNSAIGRGVGGIIPDAVVPILERYRRILT